MTLLAGNISDEEAFSRVSRFFQDYVEPNSAAISIPIALIGNTAYTALAACFSILDLITCKDPSPTLRELRSSREIIAVPYFYLLKTLNPQAEVPAKPESSIRNGIPSGIIFKAMQNAIKAPMKSLFESENAFKREIVLRLAMLLLAACSVICRLADGIIGVIAAALSILTIGEIPKINNIAFKALQITAVIEDVWYSAFGFLCPKILIEDWFQPDSPTIQPNNPTNRLYDSSFNDEFLINFVKNHLKK